MLLCMKKRLPLLLAAFLLTTGWTIRDLGTLPGGGLSAANTVNNGGMVGGMAGNAAGVMRAVWWDAATGTIHEIPTPIVPGRFSTVYGINDKGAMVGRMGTTTSDAHAFKYQFSTLTDLTASSASIAFAISPSNNIAGQWSVAGTPPQHYAVVWGGGTPGTPFSLGGFGGWVDFASDVSDRPVAAGTSALPTGRRHAFLWVSGTMRDLGTLGGNNSFGRSLLVGAWPDPTEASIFVVGESEIIPGSFDTRAFLYNMGTMTDLGTLPGCTRTEAYAINKSKHVVGTCHTADGASYAWLWNGVSMVALETLIDPAAGWTQLQDAHDISDTGKIVGHGWHLGQFRAFIMTP
jgi:probable HAF family extracellular repeat protein